MQDSGPEARPRPGARRRSAALPAEYEPTPAEARIVVEGDVQGGIRVIRQEVRVNTNHGTIVQQVLDSVHERRPNVGAPPAPEPFIGRGPELDQLRAVRRGRGVTVSGPRGSGRTSLMRAAAATIESLPIDTVVAVEGTGDDGRALSADEIAQLVHDQAFRAEPSDKVTVASLRAELRGTRGIAILDDLALWGRDLEDLAALFAEGAVLISTTGPVMDASLDDVPVGRLPRADAIGLLAERSGLELAGDAGGGGLDEVAALLDDWPEAIVVAGRAIKVRGLSPTDARAELAAAQTQAAQPADVAIERAYALAYPALDANARHVIVTAAVLPGRSHDPEILRRVLGSPDRFDAALETLGELGLLFRNSPRLRTPDGLRAIIREHERAAVVAAARDRHLEVVAALERDRVLNTALGDGELGGITGAFDHAVRSGRFDLAVDLGRAISPRLVLAGLWDLWQSVAQDVRSAAARFNRPADEAWAIHELGTRELGLGNVGRARELLTDALRRRRALGDTAGAAYTLHNLRWLILGPGGSGDRPNGNGGGDLGRRLAIGVGIVALEIALLVLAGPTAATLFDRIVGGADPSTAPTATAPSSAEPSASRSARPSPGPSGSAVAELVVFTRDHGYDWDGQSWFGMLEVTASGGSPPYRVDLRGGPGADALPASFPIAGEGCIERVVPGTVSSADGQVRDFEAVLVPDPCRPPTPPPPTAPPPTAPPPACVDFENLQLDNAIGRDAGHRPGDTLVTTDRKVRVTLQEAVDGDVYTWGSGGVVAADGFGRGLAVWTGSTSLAFDYLGLDFVPTTIEFAWSDGGSGAWMAINGGDYAHAFFYEADQLDLGGAELTIERTEDSRGRATIRGGPIDRLVIGGVEFFVDEVCAAP